MKSYVTAFANPAHNSQVDMPTFVPRTFSRALDSAPTANGRPEFVLTSPSVDHVAAVGAGLYAALNASDGGPRTREGARVHYLGTTGRWTGTGFRAWGAPAPVVEWGAPPTESWPPQTWANLVQLAIEPDKEGWIGVSSLSGGEQRDSDAYLTRVSGGELTHGVRTDRPLTDAFIDANGIVVWSAKGLARYARPDEPSPSIFQPSKWKVAKPLFQRAFTDRRRPNAMSGVDGGIAVVGGDSSLAMDTEGEHSWSTWLLVLDKDGRDRWTADVPWAVRQPPIEGGGGRVYLAGDRLEALDSGVSMWSLPAGKRVRATAFSDGGVAITRGSALQIYSRDGEKLASFETPDADELITPPAIASDGSIWAASAAHLYVGR